MTLAKLDLEIYQAQIDVCVRDGRNVLLVGRPGSGKTILARNALKALPAPSEREAHEIGFVLRMAGLPAVAAIDGRPFRAPHHTASARGMGLRRGEVGEWTIAHQGILFLAELPEFRLSILEQLAFALERPRTHGPRGVIADMNPCPCGFYGGDSGRTCCCSEDTRARYVARIKRVRDHFEVVNIDA